MSGETGWYRGDQKPVRVGVYPRLYRNNFLFFCYWNGRVWGYGAGTPEAALINPGESADQSLPWRGKTTRSGK